MLHPVSSYWYYHLWIIFWFCLPLNHTVVPTAEVRLISQRVMDYCCVYHGQLFLPVFLLLTEPSYCVPGDINCNKEDLKIMSSVTQDDDHQSSNVILSIWEYDKVYRRGAKGNKDRWYYGLYRNEYNIWKSTKALMHLTRSGGHRISQCSVDILPKYQSQFKSLKEKK